MFDEALKATWKRAESGAQPLDRAELEDLLRPVARWSGRALELVAWMYLALLVATAALAVANLPGYRENATMLAVEVGLLVVARAGAGVNGWLIAGLRRSARAAPSRVQTVERRLAFHERWFGTWLVIGAVTPYLLSLAINTLIDNQDGGYRINHPIEFTVVTAFMLGFTYLMLRVSLAPSVSAMRAVLEDLRAQALDATAEVVAVRRRTRVLLAIGTALLVLGVIAGLWMWWQAS